MTAAPTDLPSSALSVSRAAAEHDLIARIARGQNLLRRSIHRRPDVVAFARELAEWSGHNREVLAKRFADRRLADAYSSAAEPFVVPAHDIAVAAQADLLRRQLAHQLDWLDRLRRSLPERRDPHMTSRGRAERTPAVLASGDSRLAVRVVGAVARATGVLPTVIEGNRSDGESLLQAAEDTLAADTVAVVVVEPEHAESLVALGYVIGALGPDDVIAVCASEANEIIDLTAIVTVTIDDTDRWRHDLARLLGQAGFQEVEVAVAAP